MPRRGQARPRVRRVRRAPHQPALSRSVAAVEDLVVHRGSGGHGVRSRAGGCVRADDAAIRAAGGGADRRARPGTRGARGPAAAPLSGVGIFVPKMPPVSRILVLLLGIASGLPAQTAHSGSGPRARLEGKWQAKTEDEIRNIIVRSDSSAQFGDQVARWRVVDDSLWLTLGGGVWQVDRLKLDDDQLTRSGGDPGKPGNRRPGGPAPPPP